MGVPAASFLESYPDDVKNMKLSILNYVKALRTKKGQSDVPFGIGNDEEQPKVVLDTTTDGYPILPRPLPSEKWSKRQWEHLFKTYVGRHYRKFP
jgi:hypothetical protein